jgi:GTP pyrophosphokinase
MVFTPKGTLVSLPKGASALDFAYEIHTEIGNKAIGAKINHKLNPISTVLMSGDQVEIITSDIAKPEREWLSYVTTSKAKEAIKSLLRAESTNRIQRGMEILEMKLAEIGATPNTEILKKLMQAYDVPNKDELYSGIELGTINPDNLKKVIRKSPAKNVIKYWELKLLGPKKDKKEEGDETIAGRIDPSAPFLLRENIENAGQSYEIAKCCNPIPGDEVIGYHSPQGSIIIHKPKCPAAIRIMSNEGNRILPVRWAIHKLVSFLARIKVSGVDRIGLVNDLTNIISSELKVNMTNINFNVREGIFEGTIDLFVHHTQDLNNLILKLSNVKGIDTISRVEDFS